MDTHIPIPAGGCVPLLIDAEGRAIRGAFAFVDAADHARLETDRAGFLHPGEGRVFAGLPAVRRRQSYLLGRYAAKQALVSVLSGADPTGIEIVAGVLDQPVVLHGTGEPVDVSISHCDSLACAVAFPAIFPMGIDVEPIDVGRAETMRSQILPDELALAHVVAAGEAAACTLVWTVKEALSKVLRCGLTVPFDLLAVDRLERGPGVVRGTFRNFGQYGFHAWLGEGFVLSLVAPKRSTLGSDLAPAIAAMGRT